MCVCDCVMCVYSEPFAIFFSLPANSDYTPLTRPFTFSAATSNVTFTVDILADNTIEDTQAFSVVMLTSDRAVTNTGLSTTIYILDNDRE